MKHLLWIPIRLIQEDIQKIKEGNWNPFTTPIFI